MKMHSITARFLQFRKKQQIFALSLLITTSLLIVSVSGNLEIDQSKTLSTKLGIQIPNDKTPRLNLETNEYSLGEEETFDVSYPDLRTLTARCVYISEKGYFFLENAIADTANFTQAGEMVDNHMIPLLTENFVAPTDIDNNGKIVLLFANLPGVGGYFSPSTYLSYGEIVYMNSGSGSIPYPTLVHELQHLVSRGYDYEEKIWFNEGCSVFSEYLYDLSLGSGEDYGVFSPRDVSLLYWNYENASQVTDYAAAGSFISYLYDQYGGANLSAIYQASDNGVKLHSSNAIMHVLNSYYPDLTFERLYLDWIIASLIDREYVGDNRAYYFESFDSYPNAYRYPELSGTRIHYPYEATPEIYPWASSLYLFRNFENPGEVNITIEIPENSQSHKFGVNILKKIVKDEKVSYNINTFIFSPENISQGYHESFNATAESCERFFLSISHIDGGEGGYYWDIPSEELDVEFSIMVTSNLPNISSETTNTTSTPVSFDLSLFFLIIGGFIFIIRRRK